MRGRGDTMVRVAPEDTPSMAHRAGLPAKFVPATRNIVDGILRRRNVTDQDAPDTRSVMAYAADNTARTPVVLALLIAITASHAAKATDRTPTAVDVYPPQIQLTTSRDHQSIVVQAVFADGITRDVTDEAAVAVADVGIARFDNGVIHPVADGATTVAAEFAGLTATVPVEVAQSAVDRPVSFQLDVMPVFMKAGCNSGSCHGAARGKDGFRLSLFGFDPQGDYFRLTREVPDRRINLALPAECLLLGKATGSVPHTGGTRFDVDSPYFQTLLRWLQAGAPRDAGVIPAVDEVKIYPPGAVLDGPGASQRVIVRARYSDGTTRDVTALAFFMTNNDDAAPITQQGVVTAKNRGEAFVMARFETHTVGTHFIVLPSNLEFQWTEVPELNYIDTHIHAKLRKLRIRPSQVCTDEEFLRRATLDITGTLPTEEEYRAFMASDDAEKRKRLVDELLQRKEFVEMWVMKWAELLQIRTTPQMSYKSMLRYYNWLQERIAGNVPINQLVKELLASVGGTFANAATNYYQNETDTLKIAENVAQVFLGMRIQCAQCHNHPFDRWTMDDYYSFAAFFSQIGRKQGEDPREQIVFNAGSGEVKHPVDGRVMPPKFLGGDSPDTAGKDRRAVLAEWIGSTDNPYFARNLANIVWAHFFGRGIIDEVDDVRVTNPAVNPELLDALAEKFVEYQYDFKKLVRDICTSRTYQLSTVTNESNANDLSNFSHAILRRLRAEILLDAISQVTDAQNKFRGLPLGARAVQIADGNTSTYFLTTFGRAKRETVCSCEVSMEPNLSQALHLLNGDTVHSKIQQANQGNVVDQLLKQGKSTREVVEALYIRCLCRTPTDEEHAAVEKVLAEYDDPKLGLEDTFWALLNSREFLFNH